MANASDNSPNMHDARNSTPVEQRFLRTERVLEAVEDWARATREQVECGKLPSQSLHSMRGKTTTSAFDRELIRVTINVTYETEPC